MVGPGCEFAFPLHCAAASGRLGVVEGLLARWPSGSEAAASRGGLMDCEFVGAGVVACAGSDPLPLSGGGARGESTRASVGDLNSIDVRTRFVAYDRPMN